MESRCYCGKAKVVIHTQEHSTMHCHCNMCRRQSGADYTTWVTINAAQVDLPKNSESAQTFAIGEHASVCFCSSCGTTIYALDNRYPNIVAFHAGTLRDFVVSPASADYFYSHKAEWLDEANSRKRFGGDDGFTELSN